MRAVLLESSKLHVAEVPVPVPGPGEVLVDVLACGICGSDLHSAKHAADFNAATKAAMGVELMDLSQPVVFGHEFVGRVAAYGPEVEGAPAIGARVVSMPALVRETPAYHGFSGPEMPGGFAEQILLSAPLLIEVPDHVPTEHAALTEPLAVAYRAVAKADLGPHDVPLVVGCGPIGLAVIAILRMRGVGPIVAADFSPKRRELAAALGAEIVVDPAQTSPYDAWLQAASTDDPERMAEGTPLFGTLPLRPTVAFECVGVPGVIQQIVGGAPAGTRIVVAGVCMVEDTFEPAQAILKEIDVRFAIMYSPEEFAQTFAHIAAGDIDVAPLISGTIGLDDVPAKFEELSTAPADGKILIMPQV